MAGMVLRKTGVVLLTILKWILQAVPVALKLLPGMAKLFPLLPAPVTEDYTDDGRCFGRQTVRGAYASALKGGKYVDAEILQGICTGQGTEKDAYILGQDEVASWEETMHRIRDRPGQTYQCRIMQDCAGICIILDNRRCRKVHLVLAELIQKYKIRKPVRC